MYAEEFRIQTCLLKIFYATFYSRQLWKWISFSWIKKSWNLSKYNLQYYFKTISLHFMYSLEYRFLLPVFPVLAYMLPSIELWRRTVKGGQIFIYRLRRVLYICALWKTNHPELILLVARSIRQWLWSSLFIPSLLFQRIRKSGHHTAHRVYIIVGKVKKKNQP